MQVTDVGLYTASQPLAGGLAGPLQGGAVIHTPLPTSFTDLHSTGFVWVARETQLNVQVHSEGNPTPGCGPNAIQGTQKLFCTRSALRMLPGVWRRFVILATP